MDDKIYRGPGHPVGAHFHSGPPGKQGLPGVSPKVDMAYNEEEGTVVFTVTDGYGQREQTVPVSERIDEWADEHGHEAVDEWLDDHPEATTTVQDGSVTVAKFHSSVVDSTLTQSGHPADAAAVGATAEGLDDRLQLLEDGAPEIISEATQDWLDDHVTPTGSAVIVDNSLTQSGAAADAKKTGDAVNDLKSDLNYNHTAEPGYILRATNTGHGNEWAMVGTPTDAQAEEAINKWLDEHPEATTTVQDGALTEPKFSNALKLKTIKDYVTPEMYGAVGDGVTDDTTAVQEAFDYAKNNGGCVLLKNRYAVSSTIKAYGEVHTTDRSRIKAIHSMEYVVIYNPDQWRPPEEGQERTIPRNVNVTLSVDANNLATYGIGVGYSNQNRLNLLVVNAKTYGVNLGYITSGNAENYFNIYVAGHTLADYGVVGNGGDNTYGIIVTVDCRVGIRVDGYMLAAHEIHCWLNDVDNFTGSAVLQIDGGGNVSVRHFIQDTMQFGVINNSVRSTVNVGQYVISITSDIDASTVFVNSTDNLNYSIEITIEKYRMSKAGVVQSIFNYNESSYVQVSVREDPRQATTFNSMPTQGIFTETIDNNVCVVDLKSVLNRRVQTVYGVAGLSIREKVGDNSWTEKTIRYDTPRIERGIATIPASSTNGWQTVTVTFDEPFTSAPYVVASHSSWNNVSSAAAPVVIKVTEASISSFTVGYYGTNTRDIIVAWIAVA